MGSAGCSIQPIKKDVHRIQRRTHLFPKSCRRFPEYPESGLAAYDWFIACACQVPRDQGTMRHSSLSAQIEPMRWFLLSHTKRWGGPQDL